MISHKFTRQLWESILKDTSHRKNNLKSPRRYDLRESDNNVSNDEVYNRNLPLSKKIEWLLDYFTSISYKDLTYAASETNSEYIIYPKNKTAQRYLEDYFRQNQKSTRIYTIEGEEIPAILPIYFNTSGTGINYNRRINSPTGIPDFLKGIGLGAKCYLAATEVYGYVMSNHYNRSPSANAMWEGLERYALRTGDFIIINTNDEQQILAAGISGLRKAIRELNLTYSDIDPDRSEIPSAYVKYLRRLDNTKKTNSDEKDRDTDYEDDDEYDDKDNSDDEYDDKDNSGDDTTTDKDDDMVGGNNDSIRDDFDTIQDDYRYRSLMYHCKELLEKCDGLTSNSSIWPLRGFVGATKQLLWRNGGVITLKNLVKNFRFGNSFTQALQRHKTVFRRLVLDIYVEYRELQQDWGDVPTMNLSGSFSAENKDTQIGCLLYLLEFFNKPVIIKLFVDPKKYNLSTTLNDFKELYISNSEKVLNPKYMASVIVNVLKKYGTTEYYWVERCKEYLQMVRSVYDAIPEAIKDRFNLQNL